MDALPVAFAKASPPPAPERPHGDLGRLIQDFLQDAVRSEQTPRVLVARDEREPGEQADGTAHPTPSTSTEESRHVSQLLEPLRPSWHDLADDLGAEACSAGPGLAVTDRISLSA